MLTVLAAVLFLVLFKRVFIVPSNLSHLPRAPILPLLLSYLSGEAEDQRIRRILLPFANDHGCPLVLVWAFGMWIVHVIDYKTGDAVMKDRDWVRQLPPQDLLFWRLVGSSNVVFTTGETWKKHSRAVNAAFQGPAPIETFVYVTRDLFKVLDEGSIVQWDDLTQRITLDVLGKAIMGYDFKAVLDPSSPFASGYRHIAQALTAPPYIFLPFLERWFPRRNLIQAVAGLRAKFTAIIEEKQSKKGQDVISRMLDSSLLTLGDILDNVAILFVAGHETTSGALSSVVYYLAKFPHYQEQARREVLALINDSEAPDQDALTRMNFLLACIEEALRMNSPSNFTLPREANKMTVLNGFSIPPKTMMCFNMLSIHHLESMWTNHDVYDPNRFLDLTDTSLVSFGLGLRHCPARHFAMWELRTIMSMLLANYKWYLPLNSPHKEYVRNGFSFSTNLNLPKNLYIEFQKI